MADVRQLIGDLVDPDSKKGAVARAALLALKQDAVEPLLAALDDHNSALRISAAAMLLQFEDSHTRIVPKLVRLTRDPEERVRSCITSWLSILKGHPEVIAGLQQVGRDSNEQAGIRHLALLSLDKVGAQTAANDIRLELLQSNDQQVVREAVADLAKSGEPRAAEALIDLLKQQPDNLLVGLVLEALAKLRDPRAFAAIAAYLGDRDGYRRGVAAQALGNLGDTRAIELLQKLNSDSAQAWQEDRGPNITVQELAKEALRKLGVAASPASGARPWWKLW